MIKKIVYIFFIYLLLLRCQNIQLTQALFTDQGTSSGSFQAGHWIQPVISNVSHLIATPQETNDIPKATITWNTDENATSNLEYKTNLADPWTAVLPDDITADNTSHSREITGLLDNTTYYYQVKSKDTADNESVSATYSFTTGDVNPGVPFPSDIVINEFLPDPTGADDAAMPNGEWVELFNRGSTVQDLSGWSLSVTSNPGYRLSLTSANTSSMSIDPDGFAVIYRNSDPLFEMLNTGDTIQLRDPSGSVVDEYAYTASQIAENKSMARFPDGTDSWFDPIPTPGRPNMLEPPQSIDQLQSIDLISPTPTLTLTPTPTLTSPPSLEMNFINDKKAVSINLFNLAGYLELSYQLTYTAYSVEKGVIGNDVNISGKNDYSKEIDLATCSNEICTYDENVKNLKLKAILINQAGEKTIIEKNL